jgi:hypothetical protein
MRFTNLGALEHNLGLYTSFYVNLFEMLKFAENYAQDIDKIFYPSKYDNLYTNRKPLSSLVD